MKALIKSIILLCFFSAFENQYLFSQDSLSVTPDSISVTPDSISVAPDSISVAPDSISVKPDSMNTLYKVDSINCYFVIEQPAQFLGGDIDYFRIYIKNKMKAYTYISVENRADIKFTVDCYGNIKNVELLRSSGSSRFDKIVMGIIKDSPKWSPARQGDTYVNQQFVIPVK
jgi:TonB family protein